MDARLVGSAPLHACLPPLCSRGEDTADSWVQGAARFRQRREQGPTDMQGLPVARPRPEGRQQRVRDALVRR